MQNQPLDYRGWINQDANKRWALDFVGNDYNNGQGGAGFSDSAQSKNIAAQVGNTLNMATAPVTNARANQANQILGYANEYQKYLDGFGNQQTQVVDPYAAQRRNQIAQLEGQLGQLDRQQEIGLRNIDSSYNLGLNRLNEQNAVAKRNYDQQGQSNTQNYLQTRNGIMQNTRAQANALQRLLGLNGAGYSSAATEAAPYATALQSSTQLGGAQRTYGQNQQTLDTNWQDTQRSYKNSREDLDSQRYSQQNSLRSSIAQTRASLLDKIQSANGTSQYQGQINDLLSQITGLSNQYAKPVLKAADLNLQAPSLANYTLDNFDIQPGQQGGGQSDISPTFLGLLGQQYDEYGNLITA